MEASDGSGVNFCLRLGVFVERVVNCITYCDIGRRSLYGIGNNSY